MCPESPLTFVTAELFIATLEQTYTIPDSTPFLNLEFTLPTTVADPTGTGTSLFSDSVSVSIDDGTNAYDLLLIDQSGATPDPFGTAPGSVTVGVPENSNQDFILSADLSAIADPNVTVFMDLVQEDDGVSNTYQFDGFFQSVNPGANAETPEPKSLAILFAIATAGMLWYGNVRRKNTVSPS